MITLTKRDKRDIIWVALMVLAIGIAADLRTPIKYVQMVACTGLLILKLRGLFGKLKERNDDTSKN